MPRDLAQNSDDVREGMRSPDIVSFWNLKELLLLLTLHCCLRLLSLHWSGHCAPVVAALAGSRDRGNITCMELSGELRATACALRKLQNRAGNWRSVVRIVLPLCA